jgi:hypothetical protein
MTNVKYVGMSMSVSTHVYKEGFFLRVIYSSFCLIQPLVFSFYESSIVPPSLFFPVFGIRSCRQTSLFLSPHHATSWITRQR